MASEEVKQQEVDDAPVRKETLGQFLYNSDKGTVLGRTGISWLKITVFYCIFYCFLAGWFAGLLHAFYSTLDDIAPTYYGYSSLLQDNPAMGMRPMPIHDSTMIRFSQGSDSSYRPYIDHLQAFFEFYKDVDGNVDCSVDKVPTEVGCNVPVDQYLAELGAERDADYGYYAGTPVVVVKMNKLFDFVPVVFNSTAEIESILEENEVLNLDRLAFTPGNVGVSCDGQNAVDRQYIKRIEFAPKDGLSANYFPYLNQKGYRSPLLMVKFAEVKKRVTIQVTCKLWALNIDNTDGKEKRGSVHFELYIQ